jgi:glucosylceramidase
VLCAATREDLECTAFVNPDGSVVAVVLNRTDADISFNLRMADGLQTQATLPAHAIATFVAQLP